MRYSRLISANARRAAASTPFTGNSMHASRTPCPSCRSVLSSEAPSARNFRAIPLKSAGRIRCPTLPTSPDALWLPCVYSRLYRDTPARCWLPPWDSLPLLSSFRQFSEVSCNRPKSDSPWAGILALRVTGRAWRPTTTSLLPLQFLSEPRIVFADGVVVDPDDTP